MGPTTHEHPRGRRFAALAGLALLTASLGAGALSLALFTDTASSTGSFSTGSIDITTSPSVAFNAPAMMPGDKVEQAILVKNAGTAQFRYAVTTTDDGADLADALVGRVFAGSACTGTALYDGALSGLKVGDPAQGPDTGDRVLAASGQESLCFQVELPAGTTDSALEGATTEVTFHFDAEQTKNNP